MLLILILCVMLRIKELPQFFYVIHTINNLFPRKRCFSVCSRSGQLASLLPHCRTNADQFNPILQQETLSSDKFARLWKPGCWLAGSDQLTFLTVRSWFYQDSSSWHQQQYLKYAWVKLKQQYNLNQITLPRKQRGRQMRIIYKRKRMPGCRTSFSCVGKQHHKINDLLQAWRGGMFPFKRWRNGD